MQNKYLLNESWSGNLIYKTGYGSKNKWWGEALLGLYHLFPPHIIKPLPWSKYLHKNLKTFLRSLAGNMTDLIQPPYSASGKTDLQPKCVHD